MRNPQELRDLARECRMRTNPSLKPTVNRQLWLWAAELADYADEIERRRKLLRRGRVTRKMGKAALVPAACPAGPSYCTRRVKIFDHTPGWMLRPVRSLGRRRRTP